MCQYNHCVAEDGSGRATKWLEENDPAHCGLCLQYQVLNLLSFKEAEMIEWRLLHIYTLLDLYGSVHVVPLKVLLVVKVICFCILSILSFSSACRFYLKTTKWAHLDISMLFGPYSKFGDSDERSTVLEHELWSMCGCLCQLIRVDALAKYHGWIAFHRVTEHLKTVICTLLFPRRKVMLKITWSTWSYLTNTNLWVYFNLPFNYYELCHH